jgi:hypothetical protein
MQRGAATTWSQHKDPLLALYAFNAGLLALKMFILAVSTGVARKMKKVLQKHCVANSPCAYLERQWGICVEKFHT